MWEKVMKEEGCTFVPKTNKRVNSQLVQDDVILRNSKFLDQKQEKLSYMAQTQKTAYDFKPKLISKPYRDGLDHSPEPFSDRLYNKAAEYELKKEELRRNKVDEDCTFKPQLAKMTNQILLSRGIFNN